MQVCRFNCNINHAHRLDVPAHARRFGLPPFEDPHNSANYAKHDALEAQLREEAAQEAAFLAQRGAGRDTLPIGDVPWGLLP